MEDDYHEQVDALRVAAVEGDSLVTYLGSEAKRHPAEVVHGLVEGLAREAASLLWERRRGERVGRDMSQTSSRRVEALAKMATMLLDSKRLRVLTTDHRSEVMCRVEALWLQTVEEAVSETLPDPKSFMVCLRSAMMGWRESIDSPTT